jgi:hypothetical protein
LICIVTIGVVIILLPKPMNLSDLSWDVEAGNTFQYDIRAWGYSQYGAVISGQVVPLNGTSITVTVVILPSFEAIHDAESFASEVIFRNKVTCTFTNGTALNQWENTTLCEMVSGCILPIGDWSTMNTLFPDDNPGFTPNGEFLTTILYDDWFIIEYGWWGTFDVGGHWTGNVSLSTGIPSSILWSYFHGVDTLLYIELTLVE